MLASEKEKSYRDYWSGPAFLREFRARRLRSASSMAVKGPSKTSAKSPLKGLPKNFNQALLVESALVNIVIQDLFGKLPIISIGFKPKVGLLSVKSVNIEIIASYAK